MDENGHAPLTKQNILDMVDFVPLEGSDLTYVGGPIGEDEVTFSISNGDTVHYGSTA